MERSAEAVGAVVNAGVEADADANVSGDLVPMSNGAVIPKLYVTVNGTGVPMVPKETEGRRGKGPDGRARTRKARLGCVCMQTTLDAAGQPIREPDSWTYVGTLETVTRFGSVVYRRRGLEQADEVIVIGDGAPWSWGLADEHFPRRTDRRPIPRP